MEASENDALDEAYCLTILLSHVAPAINKERTYEILVEFLYVADLSPLMLAHYGKLIRKSSNMMAEGEGTH
jgi:negative regulator of genetic competence, sporulation and motility